MLKRLTRISQQSCLEAHLILLQVEECTVVTKEMEANVPFRSESKRLRAAVGEGKLGVDVLRRSDGQHSAINLEIQGRERVDLEAVDSVGAVEAIPRNAVLRGEFLEEPLGHAYVLLGRCYDDLPRWGLDSSQREFLDRELSVFFGRVWEVKVDSFTSVLSAFSMS
ncbi:hypothetical protein L596_017761 [Steinernema carpocapsae]|uniref:Uncharacterized protein n=1 Tax=Steinernema carpocapsae TaxID=34508 RepID=A0A4U5N2V3_STECR|nr:hypothetical protein L596_017761 [Steinernema carpocapsae]